MSTSAHAFEEDGPTPLLVYMDGPRRARVLWAGGSTVLEPLPDEPIVLGRSRKCGLLIEDPSVSRQHARLYPGNPPRIEDLGSANGTRVRGKTLTPHTPTAFGPGELVEVGATVLVVEQAGASPPPSPPLDSMATTPGVVFSDPEMKSLERLARIIAPSELTVLLLGETGVGKERFAELFHRASRRHDRAFVRINCAALAETLLESELFGHEKGAFTGAVAARAGLLEAADGGTLFLDEVGELAPATQAKLLRVLESRELLRVGGIKARTIDVRFVAATNQDLVALVEAGRFRRDLYFRLNGISLEIPPLRQRQREIPLLAAEFVRQACARSGLPEPVLTGAALGRLEAHDWPGNVRELRNVMERAVLLCEGAPIGPEHLRLEGEGASRPAPPPSLRGAESQSSGPGRENQASGRLREEVEALERQRIVAALEQSKGNQSEAAKLLGISRKTLLNRLDAFQLPRPRKDKLRM